MIDRCLNVYYRLLFRFTWLQIYQQLDQSRQLIGLSRDINSQNHLTLVNSVFGVDVPRAMSPQYQMVSLLNCVHIQSKMDSCIPHSQRLPAQLYSWMTSVMSIRPLLLINYPFSSVDGSIPQLMNQIVKEIGYRAIWRVSANLNVTENITSSIYFLKNDTIEDISIIQQISSFSAVITSGDAQLMLYALASGLPILGVPHTAEQVRKPCCLTLCREIFWFFSWNILTQLPGLELAWSHYPHLCQKNESLNSLEGFEMMPGRLRFYY